MPITVRRTFPRKSIVLCVLAACLAAGAIAGPAAAAAGQPAASRQAASLARLAEDFYAARASFDPLMTTANGDSRYDGELGLNIAPAVRAAHFARYRQLRKRVAAMTSAGLDPSQRLTLELLAWELDAELALAPFPMHLLPLDQFDNVPGTLANYAGGAGSQPLTTPGQYRAYLSRLRQLPAWIDQAVANMREGIRRGVVQPKAVSAAMLPQFRQMRSTQAETSVFYAPITNLPATFTPAEQDELRAAYRQVIAQGIAPALERLVTFIEQDYLPASRAGSGWRDLPDGAAWYQALVAHRTNLALSPDAIHQTGLREVARIEAQWALLGPKLGYTGAPKGLPAWVATQPQFKPFTSEAQVLDAYRQLDATVKPELPAYFSHLPKSAMAILPEPALSKATASDHYTPAAADGSHPGVFWVVVNDPKDYGRAGMATLYLHEAQPGHHLHAGLLKELALPDFRKFNTEYMQAAAFTEGWGLYAETLGSDFGVFDDPLFYFGHLNAELLRAVRLVVDTGVHAKGWSREQAIAYMRDTLGVSEARAVNQVQRYMAWPAQALSYKLGAMKILELRDRAKAVLGDSFRLADFHDVVLGQGTLPLPVLEARVNRWIAAAGKDGRADKH